LLRVVTVGGLLVHDPIHESGSPEIAQCDPEDG
jgi:hypothetical protein